MKGQILYSNKIVHLAVDGTNYVLAAGTSDVNSTVLDRSAHGNPQTVAFLMILGVLAASSDVTIKVQHSDSSGSGFADLAGTSQVTLSASSDDDKMLGIEISVPMKRYLRVVTTRGDGGNSTIEALLAICGDVRTEPITQAVTAGQFVQQPEFFASPIAGAA